jgi:hypothetical protein
LAILIAAIGVGTVTSTALGFTPHKQIRTAPTGYETGIGSIATQGENIAVGWRETRNGQYHQVLRYSTNGGQTFVPKIELDTTSPDPYLSLDVCNGMVVALTGPGNDLVLDMRSLDGAIEHRRDLDADTGNARSPSVACVGDRRLAAIWYDDSVSPNPVRLSVERQFDPMRSYLFDITTIPAHQGLGLAATDSMIYVVWGKNGHVRLKRFAVAGDNNATVTALPTVTLFDVIGNSNAMIAAYGSRVAVAYQDDSDLRVRMSVDNGQTFGPAHTLVDETGLDGLVAGPSSVDVRGDRVLVEVGEYDTDLSEGDPDAWREWGVYTTNSGATWQTTETHRGGLQVGAFYRRHGVVRIAEAWDPRYHGPGGTTTLPHEWIRFHSGTP